MFSSGVYLAMRSAFDAADMVALALDRPADWPVARQGYEKRMRAGPSDYSWFIYRVTNPTAVISLTGVKDGSLLQLLVENMGRINFSHGMDDERKGITGDVKIGQNGNSSYWHTVSGWTTHCVPLTSHGLSGLEWQEAQAAEGPAFYKHSFETPQAMDTFLAMKGWTKGMAWIVSTSTQ